MEAIAQEIDPQMELHNRVQELSAVYRLSSMLAGNVDVQEILNRSVRLVTEVLGVKAASARLVDEQTGELKIAAVHNLSRQYLNKGALSVDNSPIDSEALQKGIVYISN